VNKLTSAMKITIAIAASAYGSLYTLGIGLVGTGNRPLSEPLLLVLGVAFVAGILIAFLPHTPVLPILIAASVPAGLLAWLMIMGMLEKGNIMALYWLGIPIGIVALIVMPVMIRIRLWQKTGKI
jgi:hypothetical protein